MPELASLFTLAKRWAKAMLASVEEVCTHKDRAEGKCPRCGYCEHDLVLNGACYYCGETDLRVTIKPADSDLVSLTRSRDS